MTIKKKVNNKGKKGAFIVKTVTLVGKGKKANVKVTYNKNTNTAKAKITKAKKVKISKGAKAKVSKSISVKVGKGNSAKTVKIKTTYNSTKNKVKANVVKSKGAKSKSNVPTTYVNNLNKNAFYDKKAGGHKFNAPSRAKNVATLHNLTTNTILKVQFNPTSVPYNAGATYSEMVAPGMNYPLFQYVHGNSNKFDIELFYYDKPYSGQIDNAREFLLGLLPPQENKKPNKKQKVKGAFVPPKFRFVYGYIKKTLVLEGLKIDDEWLDSNGRAIMTRFTLSVVQV